MPSIYRSIDKNRAIFLNLFVKKLADLDSQLPSSNNLDLLQPVVLINFFILLDHKIHA